MTPKIVNIAAYKFVALSDLKRRRAKLRHLCGQLALKGTILLSPEGINLFVAGPRASIDALLSFLRNDPDLQNLSPKESLSDSQPFNRMLVRIKREIIAFGVPEIDPRRQTSPRLSPRQLKQWLDEGRPVTLLDTRNDYEIKLGTFKQALDLGIEDFRHFPEAVRQLPAALKSQPVVTFCTGGIRCEKAAPYLEKEGFREVYQLDGGILKYFEECQEAHYKGDCFVFDQRVALDARLQPAQAAQCYVCQAVLTAQEMQSPLYRPGVSCPECHRSSEEQQAALLQHRHEAWCAQTSPLPGLKPYRNVRPIFVPQRMDGGTVLGFLESLHSVVPREQWIQCCQDGTLLLNGRPTQPEATVRAGHRLDHIIPEMTEPKVATDLRFLYEDEAMVVVDKPAPLPMHPGGRFNRHSLIALLDPIYRPLKLRPAHRLDANTSGVTLLTKTRQHASQVQPQFEQGTVEKSYCVRVQGHPPEHVFDSRQKISAGPGRHGARGVDPHGLPAWTEFRLVRRFEDGTALLQATPRTGRTNQIRVHLWHLGWPVCGDPLYLPDGQLGHRQTLAMGDPPLCLHCESMTIRHPTHGREVNFTADRPCWAKSSL